MKSAFTVLVICLIAWPATAALAKRLLDASDRCGESSWQQLMGLCEFMAGYAFFMVSFVAMFGIPVAAVGLIYAKA